MKCAGVGEVELLAAAGGRTFDRARVSGKGVFGSGPAPGQGGKPPSPLTPRSLDVHEGARTSNRGVPETHPRAASLSPRGSDRGRGSGMPWSSDK